MNKEDFTIGQFFNQTKRIGDDAAVVGQYLYSQDAFFEDVHFKKGWINSYEIGYKAVLVNISDAIAMNAQPLYALLTMALPKDMPKTEIAKLSLGINDACKKYACEIIGGDTIANNTLALSITIVSKSKKPLLRSSVKEGSFLAYTGELGSSKSGLKSLFRGNKLNKYHRFVRPVLRKEFVFKSRPFLQAGMDISDGLFEDTKKLTASINRSFKLLKAIEKNVGCSGEEYEMLVAFLPRYKKALLRQAKRTRTKITVFAKVVRTKPQRLCKANHF